MRLGAILECVVAHETHTCRRGSFTNTSLLPIPSVIPIFIYLLANKDCICERHGVCNVRRVKGRSSFALPSREPHHLLIEKPFRQLIPQAFEVNIAGVLIKDGEIGCLMVSGRGKVLTTYTLSSVSNRIANVICLLLATAEINE